MLRLVAHPDHLLHHVQLVQRLHVVHSDGAHLRRGQHGTEGTHGVRTMNAEEKPAKARGGVEADSMVWCESCEHSLARKPYCASSVSLHCSCTVRVCVSPDRAAHPHVRHDSTEVLLEVEVDHAVCLVNRQHLARRQRQLVATQRIDEAAECRDHDVDRRRRSDGRAARRA